jgi:hypothetical protein
MNFSVSTFNLCNLQQSGHQMFGEFAWTPAQYQRKVGWTAEQLKAQPATLMAFQEVWSERALQDVFNTAGLQDNYQLVCHESCEDMNVACAVQRDWEIISAEWITAFPPELNWRSDDTRYEMDMKIDRFSRPVLKLRLRGSDARTLTLFNAHLKSRRPIAPNNDGYYGAGPDHWLDIGRALSGMRRLAEAAVLRLLVNRQLSQSADAVIVAGDCNDRNPGSVVDMLKGDARFRRGTNNRSGRRADWGLYHLLDLDKNPRDAHPDKYITFCGDEELLALDHLLFSWHFHARAADSRWHLQDWSVNNQHLGSNKPYVSDHAMVVARFIERER